MEIYHRHPIYQLQCEEECQRRIRRIVLSFGTYDTRTYKKMPSQVVVHLVEYRGDARSTAPMLVAKLKDICLLDRDRTMAN